MNALRKLMFKPKRDKSLLSQFFYADENLTAITDELDSFDGHKEPERCTQLVNKLRSGQDKLLIIVNNILHTELGPQYATTRDFRVKFPDDVLQEGLRGQLWFGAECLAAGSSILNREPESNCMRPLAKEMTLRLGSLRKKLREQCLKNGPLITEKIQEDLIVFDRLFAEFELSYVGAMVHIKTSVEYNILQNVIVLFCETTQRALKMKYLTQDMIDDYDPAIMFTIPRLAIVCGLIIHKEGPLNPDMDPVNMSEMFRPFQTLLYKIRELLWTLSKEELDTLERSLCSTDEPVELQRSMSTSSQTSQSARKKDPLDACSTNHSGGDMCNATALVGPTTLAQLCKSVSNRETENESSPADVNPSNDSLDVGAGDLSSTYKENTTATTTGVTLCTAGTAAGTGIGTMYQDEPLIDDDDGVTSLRHSKSWPQSNKSGSITVSGSLSSRSSSDCTMCVSADHCVCQQDIPYLASSLGEDRTSYHIPSAITIAAATASSGYNRSNSMQGATARMDYDNSSGSDEDTVQYVTDYLNDLFPTDDSNHLTRTVTQSSQTEELSQETASHSTSLTAPQNSSRRVAYSESDREHNEHNRLTLELSTSSGDIISDDKVTGDTDPSNKSGSIHHAKDIAFQYDSVPSKSDSVSADKSDCDINRIIRRSAESKDSCEPSSEHLRSSKGDVIVVTGRDPEKPQLNTSSGSDWDKESCTSSYMSDSHDDEEMIRAIKIAEETARKEARARYKSSTDLMHRLFVCISGVADQLQTNYASDFRHILKVVFEVTSSEVDDEDGLQYPPSSPVHRSESLDSGSINEGMEVQPEPEIEQAEPAEPHTVVTSAPVWVPDEDCDDCTACKAPFTFVRRRHHCRNCGKIFCHRCSCNYVSLPHYGHDKPVRVCMHCFTFEVPPFTQ